MDKKLNICHICSYYENILFDNLVTAQMSFTNPRVFFFKKKGTEKQYNKEYIDEIECFNNVDRVFFFSKSRKVFTQFRKQYEGTRFDLNFAHSLFTNGYIAYLAKKTYGTPYVVMVQNTDINVFYKVKPYLSSLALKILLNAAGVIFASESYKDTLLSRYIPQESKAAISSNSIVIPYGIEDIFFNQLMIEKDDLRNNSLKIICVGLICHNKNQLFLAKAISKLIKDGLDIELIVVGKTANKRIAKKLKSYSFVSIHPYMVKNELIRLYRNSDMFCMLSHTETFGLVYAEALSQGLPIVYSENQGFDKQFEEGYIGYRANPNSIKSIINSIWMVLDNYDRLKQNTLPASEVFRWDNVTEKYKNLYEKILGEIYDISDYNSEL